MKVLPYSSLQNFSYSTVTLIQDYVFLWDLANDSHITVFLGEK